MFTPTLFNLVKSSLKTFYDIDPLVVEHMALRVAVQVKFVCGRSVAVLSQAQRALCDSFSTQPLEPIL